MDFEEKWGNHYSSNQRILLVGDGDFSFSSSMALFFGSATNIVATSLDTYDILVGKYKKAKWNLLILSKLGAYTLHGVDATEMRSHSVLKTQKFDRIIFNFPHAGFHGKEDDIHLIEKHKKLVLDFFANASGMLRAHGEIHVAHKTSPPFNLWNIEDLARMNSLRLIERADFKIEDYPGYNNKRGDSSRCDEPFPLGECCTFKFISEVSLYADINNRIISVGNEYRFVRGLNHTSDIYQTPVRSDSYDFAYGQMRFDYEKSLRSLVEAYGRANPNEDQRLRNLVHLYGSENEYERIIWLR